MGKIDELPPDTIIKAVSKKGEQKLIKDIKYKDRKQVIDSCLQKGWSYPTFYQLEFTIY